MKRLIFSTIGVIITTTFIVYTAPPARESRQKEEIKTIRRSGLEISRNEVIKSTKESESRDEEQKITRNEHK